MAENTERFDQAMNKGHTAAWDQQWDQAAIYYREALQIIPDQPKALTSLALALYELQDFPEALIYYQKAARLTPNDPIPLEKVAELLERTGQQGKAIEAFMRSAELYVKNKDVNKGVDLWKHVISLNPEYLMAHSRLALVYERLDQKQEAAREYIVIASLFQHAGEVQKAAQTLTYALKVAPGSKELAHAISMIQQGRLLPKPGVSARVVTGPLPPLQPHRLVSSQQADTSDTSPDPVAETRQKAMAILAAMLFEQMELGDQDENLSTGFNQQKSGDGSSVIDSSAIMAHLSQAIDLQSRKESARAAEELEKAIDAGLDHPAVFLALGALMTDFDRLESAVRNLHRAEHDPDLALGSHLLLGQTYLKLKRGKEAARSLLEALRLADMSVAPPEQADALGMQYDPMIEAQDHLQDESGALKFCENILEMIIRPDWRAYLKKARQQLPAPFEGGAPVPLADLLSQTGSSEVMESFTHIQKLARNGQYRTAMEEAYHTLQAAPTYLPLHILMGELLLHQSMYEEATVKFQVVAHSYKVREDIGRSVSLFRRIVDLSPMDMDARGQLIELMIGAGQVDSAVEEYLRLADIYYSLADLTNVRKTYKQAFRLAQRANADQNVKIMILNRLADIEMQSLDWRQALRTYDQIRELKPGDEETRLKLIDINFRLGQESQAVGELTSYLKLLMETEKPASGVAFLERLIETQPNQPAIVRQLGEVYRLQGRREDAIAKLNAAGELYLEAGNRAGAVETILAILALDPPNKAKYQQMLAQLRGN